jgi:NADH-quinone oxidoreductase subunit J
LLLASTIAVLQVLVYAGAIMVLFLFVIMLLALDVSEVRRRPTGWQLLGGIAAIGMGAVLILAVWREQGLGFPRHPPAGFGSIETLGRVVYTAYLFPFEAVSLLLLVAIVGAVVVAKARI